MRSVRGDAKMNRKITQHTRQSHDTRNYVVQQFAYVYKVTVISLFSEEKKIQYAVI